MEPTRMESASLPAVSNPHPAPAAGQRPAPQPRPRTLPERHSVRAQVLAELNRLPEAYAMVEEVLAAHRQTIAQSGNAPGARRTLGEALRSAGVVYYNGGAYARACGAWDEALGVYRGLEREGKITGHDRAATLAEVKAASAAACNPPRKGIAGRL